MLFYIIVKIVENLSYWEKRKEKIEHTQEINKVWSFFFFFFLNEWMNNFIQRESNYKPTRHPTFFLITLTKQEVRLPKSKELYKLYIKLYLAREWVASLASLGTHLKDKKGNLDAKHFKLWITFSIVHEMSIPYTVVDLWQIFWQLHICSCTSILQWT